jgi:DNA helicase-2/ATP-dependent DNA helicase PcrA
MTNIQKQIWGAIQMSSLLDGLNDKQLEATVYAGKTLMIVAGAGSGKTRVLTHRIAYIMEQKWAWPSQILAITFTNKAASEMRERLSGMLDEDVSRRLWVATFHSTCVSILRKWHQNMGLPSSFTIYDTDDSKRLISNILDDFNLDKKQYPPKLFVGLISDQKNDLVDATNYANFAAESGEVLDEITAKVYTEYEKRLTNLNALDFDDLIGKTIELLNKSDEARSYYQEKFKYILIDEYQDTNHAQYVLVRLLRGGGSLTVVGDSDQSIYAFRGATIRNILEFEKDYEDAQTILLEQNYRSVNNILKAANSVIDKNPNRKKKNLWSDKGDGEVIAGYNAFDGYDEANHIVAKIEELASQGAHYKDIAVFYRSNAQSRSIEEKLVNARLPYKLVGGVKFYERKEIRDLIAYLHAIINRDDDIHVRRILNVPRRGIGKTTEERVAHFAYEHGCSFGDALQMLDEVDGVNAGAVKRLEEFEEVLAKLESWLDENDPDLGDIVQKVAEDTGYLEELQLSEDVQDQVRVDNIFELVEAAKSFKPQNVDPDVDAQSVEFPDLPNTGRRALELFLEQIALISDSDQIPSNDPDDPGQVTLMTLHTAKGLEFDNVFLTGFEDGTLPHRNSLDSEFELTEERRLAYVGITRARKRLFITWASRRNVFGNWVDFKISRFAKDIPEHLIEWNDEENADASTDFGDGYQASPGENGSLDEPWWAKYRN